MEILYKTSKVQRLCTDLSFAKKKLSDKAATKLMACINYLENAENFEDVANHRPYKFHELLEKGKGTFAIDIDGRKSFYRLIIEPVLPQGETLRDEFGTYRFKKIKVIEVLEVSKHYE